MTAGHDIRVEEVGNCLLCGNSGRDLYTRLPDRLFNAPGLWGFMQCPQCSLVWLSPRPVPEDLHKVYTTYYTHDGNEGRSRINVWRQKTGAAVCAAIPGYGALADGRGWRFLGKGLSLLPPFKEDGMLATMCLNGSRKGKLLDVGCGNGKFLALMRDAGWEVTGVETDPEAARIAREKFGIPVVTGTLPQAAFENEAFDAVTLSHVIEHVLDPVGLLAECCRVLKRDGRLVAITPNIQSLAHRLFGQSWRGLEPPRHLFIFSLNTLRACCQKAGLQVEVMRTSARAARFIFEVSHVVQRKGGFTSSDLTWPGRFRGAAFHAREEFTLRFSPTVGEELVLVCSRGA